MASVVQYMAGMANGFFILGRDIIAVDSGSIEGQDVFLNACMAAGIQPQQIKLIVTTHGHVDHFMNFPAMKELTGAPILCHREAAPYLRQGLWPDVVGRTPFGVAILERQAVEGPPVGHVPSVEPDILIDDDPFDLKSWGVDGNIYYTPGHSKGCISLLLDSGEAVVGDLFASLEGTPGCPAFFTYPGGKSDIIYRSIKLLLDLGAHIFYSGHGGPFTAVYVREALQKDIGLV